MRRILAAVLAAALLLTGGCSRQRLASDGAKPAPAASATATHLTPPTTAPVVAHKATTTHSTTDSDAGALLGDVDKLLAGDSSPTEDQD